MIYKILAGVIWGLVWYYFPFSHAPIITMIWIELRYLADKKHE
jgi:hypothetical protein